MEDTNTEISPVLDELVARAREAFGDNLVSVLLFGSAAEARLRAASDVNLLFLLKRFAPDEIDGFREALRTADAAIRARAMFLLEGELATAAGLFAVKFSDIRARHKVLWGSDPTAALAIGDDELRHRLREVLLNLALRLRERYAMLSLREEQLVPVIGGAAGPLRSAAAALLSLRGQGGPGLMPREALDRLVAGCGDAALAAAVEHMSRARREQQLPPGVACATLLDLIRLAERLRQEVDETAGASR